MRLNQIEETALVVGVLSMLASWFFRIRVFSRFGDDPIISELVRGTFATTFADLLSIKLFRARNNLPKESKAAIFCFITSHWAAAVLVLFALLSYSVRGWL